MTEISMALPTSEKFLYDDYPTYGVRFLLVTLGEMTVALVSGQALSIIDICFFPATLATGLVHLGTFWYILVHKYSGPAEKVIILRLRSPFASGSASRKGSP